MKIKFFYAALAFVLFGSICSSNSQTPQKQDASSDLQTVTLYSVSQGGNGRGDESKSCFSFNLGTYAQCMSMDADLGYGFLTIGIDDWFMLMHPNDARTTMKHLGRFDWTEPFKVPKLDPLPESKPGEARNAVMGPHDDNGNPDIFGNKLSASVWLGHIYEVHVKKMDLDFYVLFRVDDGEAHRGCKITWKRMPTPAKKK